jgi:hypothetical protein
LSAKYPKSAAPTGRAASVSVVATATLVLLVSNVSATSEMTKTSRK